jgi:hypothetical protein
MQAQMVQLAELLGIVGRKGNSIEETDDEQDLDFKKNKGSGEVYQGVKKYKKEGLYRGELKNGKREGKGKMIFPKGHVYIHYEGDWLND